MKASEFAEDQQHDTALENLAFIERQNEDSNSSFFVNWEVIDPVSVSYRKETSFAKIPFKSRL